MSFISAPLHGGRIASAVAVLALAACATTTTGMGGGDVQTARRGEVPVLFDWRSQDGGLSGTLSATLPERTFTGPFVQITLQTQRDSLAPFWTGWNEGWGDWPEDVAGWNTASAAEQFTRYYSGKVIANLHDAAGADMRCRFDLDDPPRGMRGGAHGQCQFAGGRILNAKIGKR